VSWTALLGLPVTAAAAATVTAATVTAAAAWCQVSNVACSCRAALTASSCRLAESTAALQAELADTLEEFEGVMDGTQDLQVEVADEVGDSTMTVVMFMMFFICVMFVMCVCDTESCV